MKWLLNLKVAHKLAFSFGACLALAVIAGLVGIQRMAAMNAGTVIDEGSPIVGVVLMSHFLNDEKEYRIHLLKYIIARDEQKRTKLLSQIAGNRADVEKDLNDYEKHISDDEDRKNFAQVRDDWNTITSDESKIINAGNTTDLDNIAQVILTDTEPGFHNARIHGEALEAWNAKRSIDISKETKTAFISARQSILVLLAFSLLVGAALAWAATQSICGDLSKLVAQISSVNKGMVGLVDNAKALAEGDFNERNLAVTPLMEWGRHDEFGKLASTFDLLHAQLKVVVKSIWKAQKTLSDLIASIRATSESLAASTGQLSAGNEDLSIRTSDQASSLQSTAANMEQMTSIVRLSAENARQANHLALKARDVASSGGEIVHRAVSSMNEISTASKKISDIVSIIDDIAFQTNLLALNAAVEAARVGEQGRGFAVVASEVRSLAGRSSTAAKEIKSLVLDSVRKVEDGTTLVNMSGEKLEQIIEAVVEVADVVAQISTGAEEQSEGIEHVNRSVMSLDEITQQNAALVEEAAAESNAMSAQAAGLITQLGEFKLQQADANAMSKHVADSYGAE